MTTVAPGEKSAKFPVFVLETLDLGGVVKKLQGEIQNQQKHETIDTMTDTTAKGFFGEFGGSFVPPRLQDALNKLEEAFDKYKEDESYQQELNYYLKEYVGRPNPLYLAQRLTDKLGGAKIYLKREDLNHTGAHKINNVMGQVLLAKRMGLNREHQVKLSTRTSIGTYMNQDPTIQKMTRTPDPVNQL